MLPSILIIGAVFCGVVMLIVGVAVLMRDQSVNQMEDRLNAMTGKGNKDPSNLAQTAQILAADYGGKTPLDKMLSKYFNLTLLFEQACFIYLNFLVKHSVFLGRQFLC